MSHDLHKAMCLLVKKKFPDKLERYFGSGDWTSVWIRNVEQYDKSEDDYYCLYCDQLLDISTTKSVIDHAIRHLKDNNLLAFI